MDFFEFLQYSESPKERVDAKNILATLNKIKLKFLQDT
jgi:hypothetical protein